MFIENKPKNLGQNIDNFIQPSLDIGITSDRNSYEEADALSMLKASRYPNADEVKAINSFGASIDNDFGSTFITPSNNDPTIARLKEDLVIHE